MRYFSRLMLVSCLALAVITVAAQTTGGGKIDGGCNTAAGCGKLKTLCASIRNHVFKSTKRDGSAGVCYLKGSQPGSTEGNSATCNGNGLQCNKFQAACERVGGSLSGSNPDSNGIPQTWTCTY